VARSFLLSERVSQVREKYGLSDAINRVVAMSKKVESLFKNFLDYNAKVLGNADAAHTMPQHQNPAFFRPILSPGKIDTSIGWIGGHPCLPSSVEWPHKNGIPYEFLCQLNLEALPETVWDGIGPRKGFLSFFMSLEGRSQVTAIYTTALGLARKEVSGWQKKNSTFHRFQEEHTPFINPPISWPLARLYESDPNIAIPNWRRKKYVDDSEFPIDDPRLHPLDWRQLELLIVSAYSASQNRREFHQKTIEWYVSTLRRKDQPSNPRDVKLLEQAKALKSQLLSFEDYLEQASKNITLQRQSNTFDRSQWQDFITYLQDSSPLLGKYWVTEYRNLRTKLTAENYDKIHPTLTPDLHDYFRLKWQFEAEGATLQIGGVPRGWGHEFTENMKKCVMLIQIPTNALTGYSFGDVSDLIISICKSDLKHKRFSKLYMDVSN